LEGDFLDDDTIEAEMDVSSSLGMSFNFSVEADVSDTDGDGTPDLIEGTDIGSTSLHGIALTYEATVSVSR